MSDEFIVGRNAVLELLKNDRSVNKILLAKGDTQGSVREIIKLACDKKIIMQEVVKARLDEIAQGLKHQGVIAYVPPVAYVELEDILAIVESKREIPCLVLLEEVQDPHNVGAILRTANATGAHGLLLPKRRSCPLSAAVAKTSAGAIEYVPVARIGNVAQTIDKLKALGFWIIGADLKGETDYYLADFKGPVIIIMGSEGQGLSRLTKEKCDMLVKIPMVGEIASLNVSVACSLLLYEVLRQRRK